MKNKTLEETLLLVQTNWPEYESFPRFIFESGTWYADAFSTNAANGETVLEALYHYIHLVQLTDSNGMDTNRFNSALKILVEHVVDPIIETYMSKMIDEL
jgi:hypothetical protein